MRAGPLVTWAIVSALAPDARADGVCAAIDTGRDSLAEHERAAVRIAILGALEREGVAIDREGRCTGMVIAYSVRLGEAVTTTLVAGDRRVTGRASSLDEVDLLVSQLVRSLVTGRSLATGSGVTDRTNVLRDQTAPRRSDAGARAWQPVFAGGGGMLQLPALPGRPRQRQYSIVALEGRTWGFSGSERSAFELTGRVLLHDYDVLGTAYDAYDRERDQTPPDSDEAGYALALLFSPFGVANWEGGIGFVSLLGDRPPRPYVRAGATVSLLCRFSDPDHRFDVGFGGYAGVGLQLTRHVGLSVAAYASSPMVHDFMDRGYRYFLTTTAMLEVHGERSRRHAPRIFRPEPPPTIRRINE